jgi:hypothetical protein
MLTFEILCFGFGCQVIVNSFELFLEISVNKLFTTGFLEYC